MRIVYFISIVALVGCSSKNENERLNVNSIVIHNAMVKEASEIESQLHLLKSDSLSILNKDSIDVLLFDLKQWENDLVEVPGNESHHEDHHHDHSNKTLEVTALQMFQIQQELDKRLKTINKRTLDLLDHSQE